MTQRPLDMDAIGMETGSSTFIDLPEVSQLEMKAPHSLESGATSLSSPGHKTVKDYERHLKTLEDTNFGLKLRVHMLEERLQQQDSPDRAQEMVVNLKVQMGELKEELSQKRKLLLTAREALENMERQYNSEMVRLQNECELRDEQNIRLEEHIFQLQTDSNRPATLNAGLDSAAEEMSDAAAAALTDAHFLAAFGPLPRRPSSSTAAAAAEQRAQQLEAQVQQLQMELDQLKENATGWTEERDGLAARAASLSTELVGQRARADQAQLLCQQLSAQRDQLQLAQRQLQKQLEGTQWTAEKLKTDLSADLSAVRDVCESLRQERDSALASRQTSADERQQLVADTDRLQTELTSCSATLLEQRHTNKGLESQLSEVLTTLKQAGERLAERTRALSDAKRRERRLVARVTSQHQERCRMLDWMRAHLDESTVQQMLSGSDVELGNGSCPGVEDVAALTTPAEPSSLPPPTASTPPPTAHSTVTAAAPPPARSSGALPGRLSPRPISDVKLQLKTSPGDSSDSPPSQILQPVQSVAAPDQPPSFGCSAVMKTSESTALIEYHTAQQLQLSDAVQRSLDDMHQLLVSQLPSGRLQEMVLQQLDLLQRQLLTAGDSAAVVPSEEGASSASVHQLRRQLFDSQHSCGLLRRRLDELAEFMDKLLRLEEDGLVDLSSCLSVGDRTDLHASLMACREASQTLAVAEHSQADSTQLMMFNSLLPDGQFEPIVEEAPRDQRLVPGGHIDEPTPVRNLLSHTLLADDTAAAPHEPSQLHAPPPLPTPADNVSESEAWSEPDRNVSMARMGLRSVSEAQHESWFCPSGVSDSEEKGYRRRRRAAMAEMRSLEAQVAKLRELKASLETELRRIGSSGVDSARGVDTVEDVPQAIGPDTGHVSDTSAEGTGSIPRNMLTEIESLQCQLQRALHANVRLRHQSSPNQSVQDECSDVAGTDSVDTLATALKITEERLDEKVAQLESSEQRVVELKSQLARARETVIQLTTRPEPAASGSVRLRRQTVDSPDALVAPSGGRLHGGQRFHSENELSSGSCRDARAICSEPQQLQLHRDRFQLLCERRQLASQRRLLRSASCLLEASGSSRRRRPELQLVDAARTSNGGDAEISPIGAQESDDQAINARVAMEEEIIKVQLLEAESERRQLQEELQQLREQHELVVEEKERLCGELAEKTELCAVSAADSERLSRQFTRLHDKYELRASDNEQLGRQLAEIQEQRARLYIDVQQLNTRVAELTRKTEVLSDDNERVNGDLAKLHENNRHLSADNDRLNGQLAELQLENGRLSSDNEQLQTQHDRLTADLKQLTTELTASNGQLDTLKANGERVCVELVASQQRCKDLTAENTGLGVSMARLQEQSQTAEAENERLGRDLVRHLEEFENQKETVDMLTRELNKLQEERQQQSSTEDKLRREVHEMKRKRKQQTATEEQLKQEVQSLQEELIGQLEAEKLRAARADQLNAELSQLREQSAQLSADNQTLSGRLARQRDTVEQHAAENVRLRQQLDELRAQNERWLREVAAQQERADSCREVDRRNSGPAGLRDMSSSAGSRLESDARRLDDCDPPAVDSSLTYQPHGDSDRTSTYSSPDLGIESDVNRGRINTGNPSSPRRSKDFATERDARGVASTSCADSGSEDLEQLRSERNQLHSQLLTTRKALGEAQDRLNRADQRKARVERAIYRQLSKTHDILQRAKSNLTVAPPDEEAAADAIKRSRSGGIREAGPRRSQSSGRVGQPAAGHRSQSRGRGAAGTSARGKENTTEGPL